jgi:hypothetical protein
MQAARDDEVRLSHEHFAAALARMRHAPTSEEAVDE